MSYTEIYGFNKEGNAYFQGEVKNALRGAMAIWGILEEKYLPPYIPEYVKCANWFYPGITYDEVVSKLGYSPTRLSPSFSKTNPAKELWDLADSDKLSRQEKIVLMTTFDYVLVKKQDLSKVVDAFIAFEGETSLAEQAKILQAIAADDSCIAVGWNQTSVNADTWASMGGYDEENGEPIPYNCLTGDKHYWLFDEIK